MAKFPRKYWQEMTTADFAALDRERVVAVLPVAAIEQHGPHLPVSVDAAINRGIVDRVIALLPNDLPVTFLPMMPIGKSNEHIAFPGTLTLSAETLIRLWTEIGESVARAGIRKLVLLNSHGGQPQIMDIVARDLRVRLKMFVVALSYWGVGMIDRAVSGVRGGARHSRRFQRDLADVASCIRNSSATRSGAISFRLRSLWSSSANILRPEGRGVGFGWQTQDLNIPARCGNALDADASAVTR